jgi:hypothetical protein
LGDREVRGEETHPLIAPQRQASGGQPIHQQDERKADTGAAAGEVATPLTLRRNMRRMQVWVLMGVGVQECYTDQGMV